MGIQRLNKRGFQFSDGFYSIIAISALVIAFGVILAQQAPIYNPSVSDELTSLNRLDNVSDLAGDQRTSISPNDRDPSEDAEANTFKGVYGILGNIFTSFDLIIGNDGMIDDVTEMFGIPPYVRQTIVAIILIAITFSLIAVIFRLARSSA
jgi:hypothetical protein